MNVFPTLSIFTVTIICFILLLAWFGLFGKRFAGPMTVRAKRLYAHLRRIAQSKRKMYNVQPTATQREAMQKFKERLKSFTVRVVNVKFKKKDKDA